MNRGLQRIATNVAWLGSGEVVLKGALFAAAAIVARGMGAAGLGVFTVAYGASLVLTQLLAAGQVEVLIRETAASPGSGPALFVGARRWQRQVAALLVPVSLAAAMLVPDPQYRWALLAFVPYAWLRARLISAGAVFKGLDRMDVEVVARGVEVTIALIGLGAAAVMGVPVWTTGLAFALGAVAGSSLVAARVHRLGDAGAPAPRELLVRQGLPFMGLALTTQLLMRSDGFMLAALGVAAEEIGRYGAATTPVWGLVAVAQLAAVAVFPTLSRLAVEGRLREGHAAIIAALALALGGALAVSLVIVREPLVVIVFGTEFRSSAELLAVTAWALPGACCTMVLGVVLAALRRQGWSLLWQAALVGVAVAGYTLAIPRWGVLGCAWTQVALQAGTAAVMLALALVATRRPGRARPVPLPLAVEP